MIKLNEVDNQDSFISDIELRFVMKFYSRTIHRDTPWRVPMFVTKCGLLSNQFIISFTENQYIRDIIYISHKIAHYNLEIVLK
jgi:hypothetical protein